jgi:hypothetical protein
VDYAVSELKNTDCKPSKAWQVTQEHSVVIALKYKVTINNGFSILNNDA